MAYESVSTYLGVFDPFQSPAWIEGLAARFGWRREPPAERVYVDFGCGPGESTLALAALYPSVRFIGIDFNPQHVDSANAQARRLRLPNARYVCADFANLPQDLPAADLLVVRGTYSWLAPEVKGTLESALARLAKPGALLKLHYNVLPGAVMREGIGRYLAAAGGANLSPETARNLMNQLRRHAPALAELFPASGPMLDSLAAMPDAAWRHDLLNEDYTAEYADRVLGRMQALGFSYVGSLPVERNFPQLLVDEVLWKQMAPRPSAQAQCMLDIATANWVRDDLLVFGTPRARASSFAGDTRLGLAFPEHKLLEPHRTVRAELKFTGDAMTAIIDQLRVRPRTWRELTETLDSKLGPQLGVHVDYLLAAGKIGFFLSEADAGRIDRARVAEINRTRLAQAVKELNPRTATPLLAAECGNCLVAGWFESLVLHHFARRGEANTQQHMLQAMQRAGMAFPGPDGKRALNQLERLRQAIARLDESYVPRMNYWGIAV